MIHDLFLKKIRELKANGIKASEIARATGISSQNLRSKIKLSRSLDADFWEKFKEFYLSKLRE